MWQLVQALDQGKGLNFAPVVCIMTTLLVTHYEANFAILYASLCTVCIMHSKPLNSEASRYTVQRLLTSLKSERQLQCHYTQSDLNSYSTTSAIVTPAYLQPLGDQHEPIPFKNTCNLILDKTMLSRVLNYF